MAIKGWFDGADRVPMVVAWVNLPRLRVLAPVTFLVDTGADRTVLHPDDAAELGIDARVLGAGVNLAGVGGSGVYRPERALLVVGDGISLYYLGMTLYIATPDAANQGLPSLLGRDMLSHFRTTYDLPTTSSNSMPSRSTSARKPHPGSGAPPRFAVRCPAQLSLEHRHASRPFRRHRPPD